MTIIAIHLEHLWKATRHLTPKEKETVMGALKEASIMDQLFEQAAMLRDYQHALRDLKRSKAATKANRTRKRTEQWHPDDIIALTAKGKAYLERQRAKKGAQP